MPPAWSTTAAFTPTFSLTLLEREALSNTVSEIPQGGALTLDRQQIVDEALRLLDEEGLDALSLCPLAGRLGVQAPTLYWHIGSKAELLDALADGIIHAVLSSDPGDDWAEWLLSGLAELRRAMLHHRDGARTIAGAACHYDAPTSRNSPSPPSSSRESSRAGRD